MSIYDKNKEVEPYVVYRFKDVKKIKDSFIAVYENALKETDIPSYAEYIRMTIQDLAEMDDSEFYEDLVDRYGLSMDEETGDAYSDKNKNGKWSSYSLGKSFRQRKEILIGKRYTSTTNGFMSVRGRWLWMPRIPRQIMKA